MQTLHPDNKHLRKLESDSDWATHNRPQRGSYRTNPQTKTSRDNFLASSDINHSLPNTNVLISRYESQVRNFIKPPFNDQKGALFYVGLLRLLILQNVQRQTERSENG